jgi:hypothetical protein
MPSPHTYGFCHDHEAPDVNL